jgi:hypothetical protein
MIQTVQAFRVAMRDASCRAKAEEDAGLTDARRKIEKAQRLVKETGLGEATCVLLKTVWHYPSWSKRPDFSNHDFAFARYRCVRRK